MWKTTFIVALSIIFIVFIICSRGEEELSASSDATSDSNQNYHEDFKNHEDNDEYVITEAKLKEIRSQFMYRFLDSGGSNNTGDWQPEIQNISPQIHKNLNFHLPFFGFRFNYTRLSLNGYLEFSDPPESNLEYPLKFPVKNWPKENDPSFIGIFYSKCRIGKLRDGDLDKRKPGVYFRTESNLHKRTDWFGVELRERTKWDIREGIIGAETFNPKHVIIVTWKNVSFAGGIEAALTKTNTFQMVLATDEIFSYAIFNYLDLQWTTHTEAGGASETGENGIPAFVGFNAGNGTRSFEYAPYSQSPTIRSLIERGWTNGFKGRHIFRLDENILPGSCIENIDGNNLPLIIAPEIGNMLGGTMVNITGPCFKITDNIKCLFDTEKVSGIVVNSNKAICIQPQLFAQGYVNLAISINGERYKWKGRYFVETPATAAEQIVVDNEAHEKNAPEIAVSWNRLNLTANNNTRVKISLWGYRETTKPELLYIDQIATDVPNNGRYTIKSKDFKHRDNANHINLHFGFLQINLTAPLRVEGSHAMIFPVIWSRPIPLAWYFTAQWERKYGKAWSEEICNSWIERDKNLPSFTQELPKCPCTLRQALGNKGRYLSDPECNNNNNNCRYHHGAAHCVLTHTQNGSGQQCCYDNNGFLMLSQDRNWGSNPRRCSNFGSKPWNKITNVPSLSHWYHDIAPNYFCCKWQNEESDGCEALRFERRPTQDCVNYQGPAVAGIFGDPHVITFNGLEFTFNGKGEFVLTRANSEEVKLDIQGRFEQMPISKDEHVKGTQLTSIVARGNSSTVIEVRLRPTDSQWRYRLDVFADHKRVYFDNPALKVQHFPGVTVYTPTLNQSVIIVTFDSGAGLEVIENKSFMSAIVYLPETFKNRARGLLGAWSSDPSRELLTPEGQRIPLPTGNNMENLYYNFGLKWMIDDKPDPNKGSALFVRDFLRSIIRYNDRGFRPEFDTIPSVPANSSVTEYEMRDFCRENNQCFYDYVVTADKNVAQLTLQSKISINDLKDINRFKVTSCGALKAPKHGRKSTLYFISGTKVEFHCIEDFILMGDTSRTCTQEGMWSVEKYGYTKCITLREYLRRRAFIMLSIMLGVLIPIILIFIFFGYKIVKWRNKRRDLKWQLAYDEPKKCAQIAATEKQTTKLEDRH